MSDYLEDLNSKDRGVRAQAREELEAMGAEALPDLIDILDSEIENAGDEARRQLKAAAGFAAGGLIGGAMAMDAANSEKRYRDVNAKARRAAAELVGKLGPAGKAALPALKDALLASRNKAVRAALRDAVKCVTGQKVTFELVDDEGNTVPPPPKKKAKKKPVGKKMQREEYSCPGCESTMRPKRTVRYHSMTFACFAIGGVLAGVLGVFLGGLGMIVGMVVGVLGMSIPRVSTYKCRGCGFVEVTQVK